ncbi:uncharacterized protein LOC142219531 [Haematobia irritans]|uniref:uncharacterized protein LOC142219531 n=1 Tax=Haematobia irritans TaxID=7368 RepID=UPI003F5030BF
MSTLSIISLTIVTILQSAVFGNYAPQSYGFNKLSSPTNLYLKNNFVDPTLPSICFSFYIPRVNEATQTYETEYAKCLFAAANDAETIENEMMEDRAQMLQRGEDICFSYRNCSMMLTSVDFFDCYHDAAGKSLPTSYNMRHQSITGLTYIAKRQEIVFRDQRSCTEKCTQTYREVTLELYSKLEACLAGEYLPPAFETTTTQISSTVTEEITPTETTSSATDETTQTPTETTKAEPPVPPTLNPPTSAITNPTPGHPEEETTPPAPPTPPIATTTVSNQTPPNHKH